MFVKMLRVRDQNLHACARARVRAPACAGEEGGWGTLLCAVASEKRESRVWETDARGRPCVLKTVHPNTSHTHTHTHGHFGGHCIHSMAPESGRSGKQVVVVSRWYGGVLLGPARFTHINNAARNLLSAEGYIKQEGQGGPLARRKKK
jgi:Uncharacterized protein family UPF0029